MENFLEPGTVKKTILFLGELEAETPLEALPGWFVIKTSKAKNKNRRLVALNRGFYDAELRSVIGNFPVKVFF